MEGNVSRNWVRHLSSPLREHSCDQGEKGDYQTPSVPRESELIHFSLYRYCVSVAEETGSTRQSNVQQGEVYSRLFLNVELQQNHEQKHMAQKEDFMSGDSFSVPQLVPTPNALIPSHVGLGSAPTPSPSSSPPKSSGSALFADHPPIPTSQSTQPILPLLPQTSSSSCSSSLLDEPLSNSVPNTTSVSAWPIPTSLSSTPTTTIAPSLTSLDLASLFPPTPSVTPPASSTSTISNPVMRRPSISAGTATRVTDILSPAISPPQTSFSVPLDSPLSSPTEDAHPLVDEVSKRLSRSKEHLPAVTRGKIETDMDMWLIEFSEKQDRLQLSIQDLLREQYVTVTKSIRERFTSLMRRNEELENETSRLKERIKVLEVKDPLNSLYIFFLIAYNLC